MGYGWRSISPEATPARGADRAPPRDPRRHVGAAQGPSHRREGAELGRPNGKVDPMRAA